MFHDPRDINRELGYRDPARDEYLKMGEGSGYALPLSLFAIVFIVGALIFFAPTTNQQTATNAPRVETSTPAPRDSDPAAGHGAAAVGFSILRVQAAPLRRGCLLLCVQGGHPQRRSISCTSGIMAQTPPQFFGR